MNLAVRSALGIPESLLAGKKDLIVGPSLQRQVVFPEEHQPAFFLSIPAKIQSPPPPQYWLTMFISFYRATEQGQDTSRKVILAATKAQSRQ